MTPERELAVAVLWLRNHLDVGSEACRKEVIRIADMVLKKHGEVTGSEYGEFVNTVLKGYRQDF